LRVLAKSGAGVPVVDTVVGDVGTATDQRILPMGKWPGGLSAAHRP